MENVVGIRVQIHPVALFTIVDSYKRRQDASRRVIGTLLGVKERAGLVEIRSGYPVPHNETEEEVRQLRYIPGCIWTHILVSRSFTEMLELSRAHTCNCTA